MLPKRTRLLQIRDDELAELERCIPELLEPAYANMNNADRIKVRRIKQILSDVRWNYGPHTDVETIEG